MHKPKLKTRLYIYMTLHYNYHSVFSTGIITPPLNTTCWSNQQAQFTCEIIEVPFKRWRVNGSTISEIDGFEWYLRHSQDSDVLTLNVTCRPEYNGTDVECVARYENWTEEKKNAVLIVQGTYM